MPRLGWTAEEGILKEWIQPNGARVEEGDPLFAVEGEKAVEEIEALDPGTLYIPEDAPEAGESVRVGTLLAYILEDGEDEPAASSGQSRFASVSPPNQPAPEPSPPRASRPEKRVPISPRARKLALQEGIDWADLKGSGRTGRIVERDITAFMDRSGAVTLSPVARRLADELGVSEAALQNAFPGQRVSAEQVRSLVAASAEEVADRTVVPFSRTRAAIARNLTASLAQTAPVTLHTELDATELARLRDQLKADDRDSVPSFNTLFLKVVASALQEHRHMNAHVEGDRTVQFAACNIGFAVHTEDGLLVPVIREVDRKNLADLQREADSLAEKARSGALRQRDMQGGTFTITNLGRWDVDGFTPILIGSQTGILGIGRVHPKPMAVTGDGGSIAIRQSVTISLTFDHRAVDGAPAAEFLQRVKTLAEQPYLWLTK